MTDLVERFLMLVYAIFLIGVLLLFMGIWRPWL